MSGWFKLREFSGSLKMIYKRGITGRDNGLYSNKMVTKLIHLHTLARPQNGLLFYDR